jgi:hypothetical protein
MTSLCIDFAILNWSKLEADVPTWWDVCLASGPRFIRMRDALRTQRVRLTTPVNLCTDGQSEVSVVSLLSSICLDRPGNVKWKPSNPTFHRIPSRPVLSLNHETVDSDAEQTIRSVWHLL